MDLALSMPLLSFLVLSIGCLTGCGSETPEPSRSGSSAVTSENGEPKQAPAPKSKTTAKTAVATLPLEGEPKLLLSAEEIRDGWIQLFDGQTLSGWTPTNDVDWHVTDDGLIEASEGEPGLLLTTVPFADFELRCEYWVATVTSSTSSIRATSSARAAWSAARNPRPSRWAKTSGARARSKSKATTSQQASTAPACSTSKTKPKTC
jgi:hypothetical protein